MADAPAPESAALLDAGLQVDVDGVARCSWAGSDPLYVAYHDQEWGRPVHDEGRMFEMLVLESFQAGLSWLTILRRREGFRAAFDDFDAMAIAGYGPDDEARLLQDERIIRNRAKIAATIGNARAVLRLHDEGESLVDLLRTAAPGGSPPQTMAEIPAQTSASQALAKDLKQRGFRFVGPTVLYALMQATGVVNDHLAGCAFRDGDPPSAADAAPGTP